MPGRITGRESQLDLDFLRPPPDMMLVDHCDRFVGRVPTAWDYHVLRVGQRRLGSQQVCPGPGHQISPHLEDEDQGNLIDVPDLQELPRPLLRWPPA